MFDMSTPVSKRYIQGDREWRERYSERDTEWGERDKEG